MTTTRSMLATLLAIASLWMLTGCAGSARGIGVKADPLAYPAGKVEACPKPMDVLVMSYPESMELAAGILRDKFPSSQISVSPDGEQIVMFNRNFWQGDVQLNVEPLVVQNLDSDDDETGITFDLKSKGVGANASLGPGYTHTAFFSGLKQAVSEKDIATNTFCNYEVLTEKGITTLAPAYIPSNLLGFQKYIDDKADRKKFEGVWSTTDNKYTLGMYYDAKDPLHRYKAFVLESKTRNWKPGEIKAKFSSLKVGRPVLGTWMMASKAENSTTWSVDTAVVASLTNTPPIALVKIYPTDPEGVDDYVSGSGTGWVVSEDCVVVTNAHVVNGASKIHIGPKQQKDRSEARILIVDKRTDIALLQMDGGSTSCNPIPVTENDKQQGNGTEVFALGFPIASVLGDDLKISEGIISSQFGIDNDATRYQITNAINPGNSGGPLVNTRGEVVGIIVEKLRESEGINFAIKAEYVKALLAQVGKEPLSRGETNSLTASGVFEKYKGSVVPVWTEM